MKKITLTIELENWAFQKDNLTVLLALAAMLDENPAFSLEDALVIAEGGQALAEAIDHWLAFIDSPRAEVVQILGRAQRLLRGAGNLPTEQPPA